MPENFTALTALNLIDTLKSCAANLNGQRARVLMQEAAFRLEETWGCIADLTDESSADDLLLAVGDAQRALNGKL